MSKRFTKGQMTMSLRGDTCRSIAADFGISESLPREIAKGRTWPDALAAAKLILLSENHDG